jgi:hypothetical protein
VAVCPLLLFRAAPEGNTRALPQDTELNKALFTSHPNPKYFLFHPSHQIFRRMHGALNVGKKDN